MLTARASLHCVSMTALVSLGVLASRVSARLSTSKSSITNVRKLQVESTEIPHSIWFTHESNILETHKPRAAYENVLKIIDAYKSAWEFDPDMIVNAVDDANCAREIAIAEPRLLRHFEDESHFPYRSDMCRAALLYLYGGYYFNTDIEAVEPYIPAEGISFASVESCNGGCFFSSFIAAAPHHPILKQSLNLILEVYENGMDTALLGPTTLARAYLNLPNDERGNVHLLSEMELQAEDYAWVRRQKGVGRCNLASHDPEAKKVHFYARIVGSGGCDHEKTDHAEKSQIDHRFWFQHKNNILKQDEHDEIYDNIMNTVSVYRDAWNEDMAALNFLDDKKCVKYIRQAKPDLVKYFEEEENGPYRGDMCKIAILYIYGGYYFDVDIKAVNAFLPTPKETFVSVSSRDGNIFFPSFIASVQEHPILEFALGEILDIYTNDGDKEWLGPRVLMKALQNLDKKQIAGVRMLEEINLDGTDAYQEVQRQRGTGNCNYVVHGAAEEQVYFFSRFVGFPGCFRPDESSDEDR